MPSDLLLQRDSRPARRLLVARVWNSMLSGGEPRLRQSGNFPLFSWLLLAATTPTECHCTSEAEPTMNVSTYRSKSSNWVRVTLVTLLLIMVWSSSLLGGTSSRSSAGSTPVPSVVSTPPSVELVAPLGSSSTGSTGSSGDSDTSEPVRNQSPSQSGPTRTRWDPTTWRTELARA